VDGSRTFFLRDASGFFPMKSHLAAAVRAGEWPWWNPWIRKRLPFFANPQVGAFYPPSALFYLLPTPLAMNWVAILHFVLLAAGFTSGSAPGPLAAAAAWAVWRWRASFAVSTTVLNNLRALAGRMDMVGVEVALGPAAGGSPPPRLFALQFLAEAQIVLVTAAVALLSRGAAKCGHRGASGSPPRSACSPSPSRRGLTAVSSCRPPSSSCNRTERRPLRRREPGELARRARS
jgi:hypothetical protein